MNIVSKTYNAISGFKDLDPGVTPVTIEEIYDGEGNILASQPLEPVVYFNEIQVDGDGEFRKETLEKAGIDASGILFMDDPDYEKKRVLRAYMSTKNLSVDASDQFIRRCHALSSSEDVVEKGTKSGKKHHSGGNWGGIQSLATKKTMLEFIENMPDDVRESLSKIKSSKEFAAEFVKWRDSLGKRLKFKNEK